MMFLLLLLHLKEVLLHILTTETFHAPTEKGRVLLLLGVLTGVGGRVVRTCFF